MKKEDFDKEMIKIQTAYNKKFAKEELRLWFKEFITTDVEEFKRAVDKTIQEVKFTPKIADIRSRIAVNPNDYYTNDKYLYLYKNLEWCEIVKENKNDN